MSVGSLFDPEPCHFEELKDDVAVFDGYITLYQMLTAIRDSHTGDYVRNEKGEPISHLIGVFNRLVSTMEYGIKPVFVLDGGYPELKAETVESRKEAKQAARENYREAVEQEDWEAARKYARQRTSISDTVLESTHELLDALGVPVVQAPSEGEAQVAEVCLNGPGDFAVTEDFDVLLYGAPSMLRKFKDGSCERIDLYRQLDDGLDVDRLRWYALLCGTDYNAGCHGVGPVTAKRIVTECSSWNDVIREAQSRDQSLDTEELDRWSRARDWFVEPEVETSYECEFRPVNFYEVRDLLVGEYGLAPRQVESGIERLRNGDYRG